jgi:peptidase E
MKTIFLNSSLDLYEKDEYENRVPHNFGNRNNILTNFKKHIKKYNNFLFIASNEMSFEITDMYANTTFKSFDLTLPFENYVVLDGRNMDRAEELVLNADLIYLCGGHVPTQLKFFEKINLKNLIQKSDAVICGISAGSMNCANIVYCPPELEKEALDKNFNRYLKGLGLTDINIFPHYDTLKDEYLAGLHQINDIVLPDSYKNEIIALIDGSYILINDNSTIIYGESYHIKDGKLKQLSDENETFAIKKQG